MPAHFTRPEAVNVVRDWIIGHGYPRPVFADLKDRHLGFYSAWIAFYNVDDVRRVIARVHIFPEGVKIFADFRGDPTLTTELNEVVEDMMEALIDAAEMSRLPKQAQEDWIMQQFPYLSGWGEIASTAVYKRVIARRKENDNGREYATPG